MVPKRRRRLLSISAIVLILALGLSFMLYGFRKNLHVYLTPSLMQEQTLQPGQIFRLGGMVKLTSLKREGLDIQFVVTDLQHEQAVFYHGITPDLFKEGSGVIAEGALSADSIFIATSILAKHDENYHPPGMIIK